MTIRTLPLGAAAVALTAAALIAGFGCKSSRETARTDQADRDRTATRPVEPARRDTARPVEPARPTDTVRPVEPARPTPGPAYPVGRPGDPAVKDSKVIKVEPAPEGAEWPETGQPKTGQPKSEQPKTEQPKAERPVPFAPPIAVTEEIEPAARWGLSWQKNARAGDFAEYEIRGVPGVTRQEVVETGERSVTVETTQMVAGARTPVARKRFAFTGEPKAAEPTKIEEKIAETTVEYKGRKLPAVRTEVFEDGKLQKTVWTSPEVPLEGVVKIENAEGQVVRQLMDYGRGGQR